MNKLNKLERDTASTYKEMLLERDAAINAKASLAEQLSAAAAERTQLDERCRKADQQAGSLMAEINLLQTRATAAEERHANEVSLRNGKADECTRLAEQLATAQAEGRGKDHLIERLQQQAVEHKSIEPIHISESDMAADAGRV